MPAIAKHLQIGRIDDLVTAAVNRVIIVIQGAA